MKKTMIIVSLILAFGTASHSQTEVAKPVQKKTYKVSVLDDKNSITKGILYSTNDTGITVKTKGDGGIPDYRKFSAEQIENLKLKRKGSIGRGMLMGAIIGFTTGAIIGLASGDDPQGEWFAMTAGEKALINGIGLGATGAIIGGAISAIAHKKFVIGKDRNRYQLIQSDLAQRSIAF